MKLFFACFICVTQRWTVHVVIKRQVVIVTVVINYCELLGK